MRIQLAIPLTLAVSVALLGLMKIRKKEQEREDKRQKFENIKLRVTHDVLGEYQTEKAETEKLLEKNKSELKELVEGASAVQARVDKAKGDAEACLGGKKSSEDEVATAEAEFNNLKVATDREKSDWATEVEVLKKQLAARSAVCDHLKKGSDQASKLCDTAEGPKKEEPKAEVPGKEEAKTDIPKQEEGKEEAKADAPKQEEGKEEAKADAPKQEEGKEQTKADTPKQEEGKEDAKADAPKQEEAKSDAPKAR